MLPAVAPLPALTAQPVPPPKVAQPPRIEVAVLGLTVVMLPVEAEPGVKSTVP